MSLSPLLLACLAATWVIWGSTYLAIKFALESFPPFFQMGSRFLVAGVLLLVWLKLRGRALPTLVEWRNAAIIGALLLVTAWVSRPTPSRRSVGAHRGVHRDHPDHRHADEFAVRRSAEPPRAGRHARRCGGCADAREGPSVHGVADRARGHHDRVRELVARQRAVAAAFSVGAGRHGLRERDALRQRACCCCFVAVGETPEWPPQPLAAWSWVYLDRVRLAARVQRLHGVARPRQCRARLELHLRESRDRARARYLARRRDRHARSNGPPRPSSRRASFCSSSAASPAKRQPETRQEPRVAQACYEGA